MTNFTPPTLPLLASHAKTYPASTVLLNLQGPDTSTTFTDLYGHSFSALGNAQIVRNTNASHPSLDPFGNDVGVLYCDGTGDGILATASNNWAWNRGDWQTDIFFKADTAGLAATRTLFDTRTGGSGNNGLMFINSSAVPIYNANAGAFVTSGTTLTVDGLWHHIRVSRVSLTTRMFLDGSLTGSSHADTIFYPSGQLSIGSTFNGGSSFKGWLSNFRDQKGVGTSTGFSVPISAFTA